MPRRFCSLNILISKDRGQAMLSFAKTIKLILTIAFICLVIWQFPSYLDQRSAVKVVESVLECWKKNDDACAQKYWMDPSNYKRLSSVERYYSLRSRSHQEKRISVHGYIRQGNNISPDEGDWEFTLLRSEGFWKISYYGVASY